MNPYFLPNRYNGVNERKVIFMTKYGNFENLVRTNIGLAEEIVTSDFCYAMGVLDTTKEPNSGVELSELDDAYDKRFFINDLNKEWVLYTIQDSGDNLVMGRISKTYERYQIARMLADMYLAFYQNFRVY